MATLDRRRILTCAGLGLALLAGVAPAIRAKERFITVASTTSTENSGLFAYLLPLFKAHTDIDVHVVALGTGQALDVARRGDADVVLVHDRTAEDAFLAEGQGVGRRNVMYNDFVLIGPRADPAHVAGLKDAVSGMRAIATARAPFISRGDRSGTHAAELRLWQKAGVDFERGKGTWYREAGAGMGALLNTAAAMDAYTLSDRATWLAFRNRGDLAILLEGDPQLYNQYGVMLVNPAQHAAVKSADGQVFIDWLVSRDGQAAIGAFRIDGEQAFFPNADSRPDQLGH